MLTNQYAASCGDYPVVLRTSRAVKIIVFVKIEFNQIFHYTRSSTPKRVTSLRGLISASLRPGNTTPFEAMSQQRRAVGNTVSDLTGPRFKPQASSYRDERVLARSTGHVLENP